MSEPCKVKCLVQQCVNAKLQIVLSDAEKNIQSEFVQVYGFFFCLKRVFCLALTR